MSKIISETFYGSREPRWLVECPKEQQISHFDQRGCVRQIKSSSHSASHIPSRLHTGNDLQSTRSSRASYFSEQPGSMTADHRQAHVYNAVPATHRTVDRPALDSSFSIPIVEFMVPLCCGKCEEKVKEQLENDEGVYGVVCDLHNQRVTVSSNLDPQWLLKRIKRIKRNSHFWRGSTYLQDAHYLATHKPTHHSQVLPQQSDRHLETREPAHHSRSSSQMLSQNQRYVAAPRSLYDGHVETQFQNRKADPEFYYPGTEYQYKSSSPNFNTSFDPEVYDALPAGSPYTAVPIPINDSLHHGHLPSSYGLQYEMEDYPLHLTGYYQSTSSSSW